MSPSWLRARTVTVRSASSGRAQTGDSELKLCVLRARRVRGLATSGSGLTAYRRVLRARRVRGLATSGSGLTAYRRLVGNEGLLVLTPLASGQIWTNTTTTTLSD
jgi:hypothetical protein